MSKLILTVDDSPSMRMLLKASLSAKGFAVETAEDGVQGLERLGQLNPDLLITDINMPQMDGFELIAQVRARSAYGGLPILVLSTEFSAEKKARAREAGATGWITAQVQLSLRDHGVPPYRLELEVTESAVMANAQRALRHLQILDDAGVRVAIDDFGTGYSSLSYLQLLPAKMVKIDQSFVRRLAGEERARTLVCSMVSLSHDLGYRVVAEGVETADALQLLGAMGCDEAQGHYLARPMELNAFERWLGASPFAMDRGIAAA